ncbi:MAG: DNA translocase FtsK [Candidatus Marinimicrobia bacterium]|nr:DNA translocase FtsK [Candidatus Neomarinimicrobiota bacterium]
MQYRRKEIVGIVLGLLAIFLLASFVTYDPTESPGGISSDLAKTNIMGIFGIYASYYMMKFSFGWATLFLPFGMGIMSYAIFTRKDIQDFLRIVAYVAATALWVSSIIAYVGISKDLWWKAEYSGLIGYSLTTFIRDLVGVYAYGILMVAMLVLIVSGFFHISLYDELLNLRDFLREKLEAIKEKRRLKSVIVSPVQPIIQNESESKVEEPSESAIENELEEDSVLEATDELEPFLASDESKYVEDVHTSENDEEEVVIESDVNTDSEEIKASETVESEEITIEDEVEIKKTDLDAQKERRARYRQYRLPSTDFLIDPEPIEISNNLDKDILHEKAEHLVHALETFGVKGKVVKISPGPVITLFEIEPGEGVRVNKFTNLADDLARVMKAQRIRVIAPIPGSKSVGIELPNDKPSIVYLKNIINSEEYVKSESKLTIGLGKTTVGEAYTFELNKMPHLLVAGATGAGKSVCINTIIVSILYKAKPDEVKFILIDPKKLELATYKSLVGYHLITAPNLEEYVMTTAENAVGILDSAITEMERRFQVFADARVRNIAEYHDRQKQNSELENIPYIVVLIDELADLMMTSGRAVEEPITRLAQKARAVGIHLVVATQRPSVDVITGLIKSNFPARISFQVSSKIDSRTIIDQMGAEQLLGRGDLLFLLPGSSSPIRLHNALIELDEIESIMEHIVAQPKPDEVMLPETKEKKVDSDFAVDEDTDELLKDAARMVIESQQASVSMLQRKFRIGYSRAGRLIDELEALGIVSGYSGSKARDVLVELSYLEMVFGDE